MSVSLPRKSAVLIVTAVLAVLVPAGCSLSPPAYAPQSAASPTGEAVS